MKVLVIGSINVDFVIDTHRIPDKGETIFANQYKILPGGKGANQAVAAARLGAQVTFLGKIGTDIFNDIALQNFKSANINTTYIQKVEGNTGCATIIIDHQDNRILNVPGVNQTFIKNDISKDLINEHDIILIQNEINKDIVDHIIDLAYESHKIIIYNPAPYIEKMSEDMLKKITYLTPNEIEVESLFGKNYKIIMEKYPEKIIVTLGEQGVKFFSNGKYEQFLPDKVKVVDTTGAGDTFNGALAAYLSMHMNLKDAIMKAEIAATESVKKFGAQDSMPWKGLNNE